MDKRKFIVLGDRTTHGGIVVTAEGKGIYTIDGIPVACVGDKVTCPKHKGVHVIVQGATGPRSTLNGKAIAREGDKVSCGASLISTGQSRATHSSGGDGASVQAALAARREALGAERVAAKGILSADSSGGITAEEARLLKEQQNENGNEKGYVAVFINFNGWGLSLRQHAALFIGREIEKDRTLYDPCGSYKKGAGLSINDPNHPVLSRVGAVSIGDQFAYLDYYLFHRLDGPNINVYGFEITKSEENQIRARLGDHDANTCQWNCAKIVSMVLKEIGPFKNLDEYTKPSSLRNALKPLTKMPYSPQEKEVLKRMKGIKGEK